VRYREEAWPVAEPVAIAEWSENKMNETNRRAKVVVKYAGGERPGERVFQVGEKGPGKGTDGRARPMADIAKRPTFTAFW